MLYYYVVVVVGRVQQVSTSGYSAKLFLSLNKLPKKWISSLQNHLVVTKGLIQLFE